jgi:chromosome segregation ATPase
MQSQVADLERQLKLVSDEYRKYRRQVEKSPLGELQTILQSTNAELQQKTKEVEHLSSKHRDDKMKLRRCLQEIAHLRNQLDRSKEDAVHQQRLEAEKMRIDLVAKQQGNNNGIDSLELRAITDDFRRVMSPKMYNASTSGSIGTTDRQQAMREPGFVPESIRREVDRLKRERDNLLLSGSYTSGDAIVQQIDQRLDELLLNSTSKV